jgi:AAA family ATP:ADP antiporter
LDLLSKLTRVERKELGTVLLAAALFFFLLCSYYILRPLREEMGIAGGTRNLPWLFQITLVATLLATPVFGWMTRRFPSRTFLVYTYRFFGVNLLIFLALLKVLPKGSEIVLGRVFYVWISVFNMFLVSLFWAFMADGFGLNQSKRLFGTIAVGGSLGATLGAGLTAFLVGVLGRVNLILISVVLLEVAVQIVRVLRVRFDRKRAERASSSSADGPVSARSVRSLDPAPRPSLWEGLLLVIRSRYLLAIAIFLFCYSFASTILYFEQANIVANAVADRAARAALFARIDFWVSFITVLLQIFVTGQIMSRLGVGWALILVPLLSVLGFLALGLSPALTVLVIFQVSRRAGNYAIMRPARETLFTILGLAEKYKAKSFLDTFVYRGGDATASALFGALRGMGLSLSVFAFAAVPLCLLWGVVGRYLGLKQKELAYESGSS